MTQQSQNDGAMKLAKSKLAAVLRAVAAKARDERDDNDPIDEGERDRTELINVLARMVEGRSIHAAFGAPGDWGYGTPIGEALRVVYAQGFGRQGELLIKASFAAFHEISSLLAVRDGATDEALKDLRQFLARALIDAGAMSEETLKRFDGERLCPAPNP